MSKKSEIIILEPGERIRKEGFCSRPIICPRCGGKGFFMKSLLPRVDLKQDCPDCQGTGEVIAFVTIDWKPNIK